MFTVNDSSRAARKKQYFKSWASYHVPMRPTDPIPYAATEHLDSFYVASYDDGGNLTTFTKFIKENTSAGSSAAASSRSPASILYCLAVPVDRDEYRPGAEIGYSETEGLQEYFRGRSVTGGSPTDWELVKVARFFEDEYRYWPNKRLKARVLHKRDGTVVRSYYDESGRELELQHNP